MKKIGILTVFVVLMIAGCQKQSADFQLEPGKLDKVDSMATVQMSNELAAMSLYLTAFYQVQIMLINSIGINYIISTILCSGITIIYTIMKLTLMTTTLTSGFPTTQQ